MHELSVFIDESGDFGPLAPHSPYYLIALVFHDQSRDISEPLDALRKHVAEAGFAENHAVHSAPLIRREDDYRNLDMTTRRKLFRALYNFTRQCDIRYRTFLFRKSEFINRDARGAGRVLDRDKLVSRMSRDIGAFTRDNLSLFQSYDRIIVYYDNGQKEVKDIINTVFSVFLDAEVKPQVRPSEYGLFQAADLLCTLQLISEKMGTCSLSNSEIEFFHSVRDLKKNYLKPLARKRLD